MQSLEKSALLKPRIELLLLLILAGVQFTTIVDFLIILPLGPQYMREFKIDMEQFERIVGAYGIAAGLAGLAAVFFLDRFDRKKALVWLYSGFALGTLYCGTAPTYHQLILARAIAGVFGGICGPIVLSIVGDVVPMARRGRAMGLVMTSFSVASIVGVPLGLIVAGNYGWHIPFFAIAALSGIVLLIGWIWIPPLRSHLEHEHEDHPVARAWAVMTHPDHLMAYVFMAGLTCAGFCVFSFVPSYLVLNVGLTQKQLPLMYLSGGIFTIFSMPWVGKWSDRAGKQRVFTIVSFLAAIPILLITNLGHVSLVAAIATSTLLMILMSGRMVPAMALMTGVVSARHRGGFMSVNSSVQQFSMGLTSILTGKIIGTAPNGQLTNFYVNGLISVACAYGCIYLTRFLKVPESSDKVSSEPILVET